MTLHRNPNIFLVGRVNPFRKSVQSILRRPAYAVNEDTMVNAESPLRDEHSDSVLRIEDVLEDSGFHELQIPLP